MNEPPLNHLRNHLMTTPNAAPMLVLNHLLHLNYLSLLCVVSTRIAYMSMEVGVVRGSGGSAINRDVRRRVCDAPITPGGAHDARASRATAKILFTIACEASGRRPAAPARVDEALRRLREARGVSGRGPGRARDTPLAPAISATVRCSRQPERARGARPAIVAPARSCAAVLRGPGPSKSLQPGAPLTTGEAADPTSSPSLKGQGVLIGAKRGEGD